MNRDADGLVTRTELWLQWADDHVARDHYQTSDANCEILTPEPRGGGGSAAHQAAGSTPYARALLIETVIERRGGDLDVYVDPCPGPRSERTDLSGAAVSRGHGGVGIHRDPGRGHSGTLAAARVDHGQGVLAVTEHTLPLPDTPLIIEDLLVRAEQMTDAGAGREAIDELLDQVAALREGRG